MFGYFKRIKDDTRFLYTKNMKNYFEGYYTKLFSKEHNFSVAIILGLSTHENKRSFIQSLNTYSNISFCTFFPLNDLSSDPSKFKLMLDKNQLSFNSILVDTPDLKVDAHFKKQRTYDKSIMGPVKYLPKLECLHSLVMTSFEASGAITIGNKTFKDDHFLGYMEKDYGRKMPKAWLWCHANSFLEDKEMSFFFSLAKVPYLGKHFNGFICLLRTKNEDYLFSSYNNSKIKNFFNNTDGYGVHIEKGDVLLYIRVTEGNKHPLQAPINTGMNRTIEESLDSTIELTLFKKGQKSIHSFSQFVSSERASSDNDFALL